METKKAEVLSQSSSEEKGGRFAFLREAFSYFRNLKFILGAIGFVIWTVYFVAISDGTIAREVKSVYEWAFKHEFYTENKKMMHAHASASKVIDSWGKIQSMGMTLNKDYIYVKKHSADVYSQLQGINAQALKLRHQAFLHYMLIEMSVVMASIEQDVSYLVLADKRVEKLFNVISSSDKSIKDSEYFLESGFANKVLHYQLNAAILRYLHGGNNEKDRIEVQRSLKSYGGCKQLLMENVYLDYVYEVTGCSRAN